MGVKGFFRIMVHAGFISSTVAPMVGLGPKFLDFVFLQTSK